MKKKFSNYEFQIILEANCAKTFFDVSFMKVLELIMKTIIIALRKNYNEMKRCFQNLLSKILHSNFKNKNFDFYVIYETFKVCLPQVIYYTYT